MRIIGGKFKGKSIEFLKSDITRPLKDSVKESIFNIIMHSKFFNVEIKDSYVYEKDRFKKLTKRFDNLLSHQGQQRFMKDQDQMISRDVMRVIWR